MKLSTKEIAYLSAIYMKKTQLSLFANINNPLDGTEEKSLAEKGVYKDGALSQAAKEVLDIVAGARICSRIVLKDSFCVVEKYAYRADEKVVLVENDAGDLLFSVPQSLSQTMSELSEFIGISRIKSVNMEALLAPEEMMVLLAMVDLYRRNAFGSYMNSLKTKAEVQFSDIVKQLDQPMPNSLVQMLKNNYHYTVPHSERTKEILEKLIGERYIINNKAYELTDVYAAFASNFLIPETIVMMETYNLNMNDEVVSASALCVCAGIKDIASFIFSKDEVELTSISGMQLLQMTENFLSCPDIT